MCVIFHIYEKTCRLSSVFFTKKKIIMKITLKNEFIAVVVRVKIE